MDKIKSQFPIYKKYPNLAYLDTGATALKPEMVIEAEDRYYREFSANIHRGVYQISEQASSEYDEARKMVANFIGAKNVAEVIFTRGTTESLNMVAAGWAADRVKTGDEVLVSQMEHHANLLPWQRLCRVTGAKLSYVPMNGDWEIDLEILGLVTKKTKVLAITHASNVLGTVNPIKEIVQLVKKKNSNTVVVVDGAQMVAHSKVDVIDLGCDFYAFSGHKAYGPTGVGVLWGKYEMLDEIEPINLGGGMISQVSWNDVTYALLPERLEAGTPPIAQVIGLAAALNWIKGIGFDGIGKTERKLTEYCWRELEKIGGLNLLGTRNLEKRSGVISFGTEGIHAHDIATILDRNGVCVRSGHHCTMPLHQLMKVDASVRVSLGIYNDEKDIDRLVEGIKEAQRIFKNLKSKI